MDDLGELRWFKALQMPNLIKMSQSLLSLKVAKAINTSNS